MAFSDGRWNECKMCLKITWQAFLNLSPLAAFCYETPNTPAPKSPEPEPAEASNWHQMSEWMGSFGEKCQWAFSISSVATSWLLFLDIQRISFGLGTRNKFQTNTSHCENRRKTTSWSTQGQKLQVFLQQYSTFLPEIRIHPGTIEQNTLILNFTVSYTAMAPPLPQSINKCIDYFHTFLPVYDVTCWQKSQLNPCWCPTATLHVWNTSDSTRRCPSWTLQPFTTTNPCPEFTATSVFQI